MQIMACLKLYFMKINYFWALCAIIATTSSEEPMAPPMEFNNDAVVQDKIVNFARRQNGNRLDRWPPGFVFARPPISPQPPGFGVACEQDYDPVACCKNAKNYWCSSPKALVQICPVSCGLCGDDDCLPETCRNAKGVDCDRYSDSQCDTDQYVRMHCPAKCAICIAGKVLCYDQNVNCCQWAKDGKCSDVTLKAMCPESCGRCGNPARFCKPQGCDDDWSAQCQNKVQLCGSDPNVTQSCPATCGVC